MLCECEHPEDEHVAVGEYVVCLGCLRTRPPAEPKTPYRIVCTIARAKVRRVSA